MRFLQDKHWRFNAMLQYDHLGQPTFFHRTVSNYFQLPSLMICAVACWGVSFEIGTALHQNMSGGYVPSCTLIASCTNSHTAGCMLLCCIDCCPVLLWLQLHENDRGCKQHLHQLFNFVSLLSCCVLCAVQLEKWEDVLAPLPLVDVVTGPLPSR